MFKVLLEIIGMRKPEKVRWTMTLSADISEWLERTAREEGVKPKDIIRRGLSAVKLAQEQREAGRPYIGFVDDPAKLDLQFVGLVNAPEKKAA